MIWVLCSKEFQFQCDDCHNLRFEKLKHIQVKGRSVHIEVFRPTRSTTRARRAVLLFVW